MTSSRKGPVSKRGGGSSRYCRRLTINDIRRPISEVVAGQDQQEAYYTPKTDQAVPELRVGEGQYQRDNHTIHYPLILTEDWSLEHLLLPVQGHIHNRALYLVLKDTLYRDQARYFEGPVYNN